MKQEPEAETKSLEETVIALTRYPSFVTQEMKTVLPENLMKMMGKRLTSTSSASAGADA